MSTTENSGGCGPSCSCGAPPRDGFALISAPRSRNLLSQEIRAARHDVEQVMIPSGSFVMGDSSGDRNPADGEWPQHTVSIQGFSMDATAVTNQAFANFIGATGYRTEAEEFGFSAVFHLAVTGSLDEVVGVADRTPWWFGVRGADWCHPGGRNSSIAGIEDHPVVHVTWNDAIAYCEWAGRRLPTEAEWEYAARGGISESKYPWGDEEVDAGGWRANIWQGEFPRVNTLDDGYLTTAPVQSFASNGYGLWQMVGNVWEWCQDVFDARYYERSLSSSPTGALSGESRVLRGGSFLCHISYCNRYRNSARSSNTPDSSMGNAGFRTVAL